MKKIVFVALLSFFAGSSAISQGTLQFNDVKIISNSVNTVPSGKIWKITSIYGFEANKCVTGAALNSCNYGGNNSVNMSVSAFKINGFTVLSECTIKRDWASNNCTGSNNSWANTEAYCGAALGTLGYATKEANPNILPIWIPAGATVESDGPNTFLSVIEFNVIP
ncbi:MAG: hypothetical protein IT223_10470 [Crocinitomicaceae bacterium]|nr:hypothetical protein [Crocinitomicaceae bacterium]